MNKLSEKKRDALQLMEEGLISNENLTLFVKGFKVLNLNWLCKENGVSNTKELLLLDKVRVLWSNFNQDENFLELSLEISEF